jgi:hypothetical protein
VPTCAVRGIRYRCRALHHLTFCRIVVLSLFVAFIFGMLISCNQGLGSATTFLTFLYCSRVVARPCTGSRPGRPSVCVGKPKAANPPRRPHGAWHGRSSSLKLGAMRSSNPLAKIRSRCGAVPCKSLAWNCKRKRSARRLSCNGLVVNGRTCCAARFLFRSFALAFSLPTC